MTFPRRVAAATANRDYPRVHGDGLPSGPLAVLFAAIFVVMVGYGITLTVLPDYTHRVHGLRGLDHRLVAVHLGVLTSVYALAQLVVGPAVGRLADRVGRRPLILWGLLGLGVTQALFGLTPSLWWLYGVRVAGGIAAALLTVAATAYIADSTSEDQRARGMAWFGTVVSLGLIAGPVLGGVLSGTGVAVGRSPLRLDGFSLPFLVAGALALAVWAAAVRALPESLGPAPALPVAAGVDSGRRRDVGLRPLLLLVTAAQFGLALFEGTFVLYARDRLAFRPSQTTLAFVVCGAVMALLQLAIVGRLARRIPARSQVAAGFLLMGTATAGLVVARSYPVVLSAVGFLAFGTAVVTPNLSALVSVSSSGRVGSALGLKSSAGSLGQFLGPLVGGTLLAWREPSPYAVGGGILLALGVATAARPRMGDPVTAARDLAPEPGDDDGRPTS